MSQLLHWKNQRLHYPGFRNGPVPLTGSYYRCLGSSMRHPKTTQEMRRSLGEPQFVRRTRYFRNLPSAWDDIWRCPRHSWKAQKRFSKQWMRRMARTTP